MRRHLANIVLAVALLASLWLNWRMRTPETIPGLEFAPDMVRSVRSNAFERNTIFSDETASRSPMPGTIPRGEVPLRYSPSRADARRAGMELSNPYSWQDRQTVERGAAVYRDFCAVCHGDEGRSDGSVVRRGYPRPPTLLRPQTREMKDGEIFHIITYGRGIMPAHGSQVSRDDRWKAIAYVRTLQAAR